MSDAQARVSASRRNPLPFVIAAVLLAFLAGLALMGLATERWRWLSPRTRPALPAAPAAPAPVPRATPTPAVPAAPLPTGDPATLAAREALLGGEIAALEARLASINADALAAAGQAGRADGMLLAFAARRAVDRGLGLGELERPLRARFGAGRPRAVALVVAATRNPVTLEDLRAGLDVLAPSLVAGGSGWWGGLRGTLGSLLVIHRAGMPSPVPADRLARIRRLVEAGQVDAAAAEVARMPGAAEATNWTAAAHRYADAHRALDALEAAALAPPPPPPPPPAPGAAAAPAPAGSPAPSPALS